MSRFSFAAAALSAAVAPVVFAQFTGPNSSQSPYVLPLMPGVTTTSVLTVGDAVGGYKMVGIPDGLGAWKNDGQTSSFNLVMNHELGGIAGIVRAHGQKGAFVSRWEIQPDLTVVSGRDHNTSSNDAYEYSAGAWSNAAGPAQNWSRFCSADLPAPSAFKFGALGTDARIFMNGEENGAEGRAYAHIVTGPNTNQTWQLPHLGKFSWENSVANPLAQQQTIVMGLDDSTVQGQVYMYLGNKQAAGNDIDKAGLTNGSVYGVRVNGLASESAATAANGRFELFSHGNVANTTGAALNTSSSNNGVTNFLRPEDGQWDPRPGRENDFYFVTTHQFNGNTRLYRMRFDDITNPTAGGQISMLLDGSQFGPNMMDNMTIDSHGRILIQEDIGGNAPLGKIWAYDIDSQGLGLIAQHDSSRFLSGAPGFLTIDEESSGIIDAKDMLGDGWFLLDVQAHYGIPGELVEGGQLVAMYLPVGVVPEPASLSLLAVGGLLLRRRH